VGSETAFGLDHRLSSQAKSVRRLRRTSPPATGERIMGKFDRRKSQKMKRRKAQVKKKEKIARRTAAPKKGAAVAPKKTAKKSAAPKV